MAELLTVVTVTSVLAGVSATLVGLMFRTQRTAEQERQAWTSLPRLAEVFRRDVHQARQVLPRLDKPDPALLITLELAPGRQVAYRQLRSAIGRDEIEAGQVVAQDRFHLPPESEVSVSKVSVAEKAADDAADNTPQAPGGQIDEGGNQAEGPKLLSLVVRRTAPHDGRQGRWVFVIDALLGRDAPRPKSLSP